MDKAALDKALRAHTNLSTFHAVIAVLEGGCVYSGVGSDKAAQQIINICKREQGRLLKIHDAALAKGDGGA
jgi:hypothetical protein